MKGGIHVHNNVYEFVCDELKDLDDKARKGELSMQDSQYADLLEHYKKSKLTSDAMEDSGYSSASYNDGYSGARGRTNAPRDNMGRYSGTSYADRNLADELPELCRELTDEALAWRGDIEKRWDEEFARNYSVT